MARDLLLVRHGESVWNELRLIQGQDDRSELNDDGRRQALEVAADLEGGPWAAIVTSDLVRARETAAIIAGRLGLPVSVDESLRERCFGILEGRPGVELTSALSGIEGDRVVDEEAHPEGGESLRELRDRLGAFVESVRGSGGPLIVVTHGGPIRAIRAYTAGRPMAGLTWDVVGNCSTWPLSI